MDITIELEEYILNIRAAVVIIHNDKVLVHRNINSNHYALVGGRVELGEDSIETVKREIKENSTNASKNTISFKKRKISFTYNKQRLIYISKSLLLIQMELW